MALQAFANLAEGVYAAASSAISRNKKISFAISSILTFIIALLFSHFSRNGLNMAHVAGVSAFCILIYCNLLYSPKNYKKAVIYAFIISAAFQLYLGWQFIGVEHDITNQMNAALAIQDGRNIYTDVHSLYANVPIHKNIEPLFTAQDFEGKNVKGDYYASPVWAYLSFVIFKLSQAFSANFSTLVHLPMIIATLLIGFILFKIMRHYKKSHRETYTAIASYIFNPLVIMVSGYHGQVDNLGIVFLALYFYMILKAQRISTFHNLVLGLSLVVKLVTAPVMPFLAAKQKKFSKMILFGIVAALPYIILVLSYPNAGLRAKLGAILPYGGVRHLWGYSRIEEYLTSLFGLNNVHQNFAYVYLLITIVMFAGIFFYFLRHQKISYLDGIILSSLVFFVFSSGFGLQYFLWMLPFLAIKANEQKFKPFYYIFIAWSSIMALFFYYGNANTYYFVRDAIGYSLIGVPLWLFMVFLLLWYLNTGMDKNKKLPTR